MLSAGGAGVESQEGGGFRGGGVERAAVSGTKKSNNTDPTQNASQVFNSTIRDNTGVTHTSHIQRLLTV